MLHPTVVFSPSPWLTPYQVLDLLVGRLSNVLLTMVSSPFTPDESPPTAEIISTPYIYIYAISPFQTFNLLYQKGKHLLAQDEFLVFPSWPVWILELFLNETGSSTVLLRLSHNQLPECFPQTVRMEVGACGYHYHILHYTCSCTAGLCILKPPSSIRCCRAFVAMH